MTRLPAVPVGQARPSRRVNVIKLIFSLSLLAAIVGFLGPRQIMAAITAADPLLLAGIFVVMTADRLLMTFKWQLLLEHSGIRFSLLEGLKIYCTAMICGMFLPTTLGPDAIRVYLTCRRGSEAEKVIASVLVERLLGFIASLAVGLLGLILLHRFHLLDHRFQEIWWSGILILAASLTGFVASFFFDLEKRQRLPSGMVGGLMRKVLKLHRAYRTFGADKKTLLVVFGLTLIEQFFPTLSIWLTALAIGLHPGLLFMAGVVPLTLLITRLPISIDGIGVFEGVFILLMGLAGIPPAQTVAIALIGRVIQTFSWLPWSLLLMLNNKRIDYPRRLGDLQGL